MFLPVFLCGMPGSGKSTLGRKLAASLKLQFIDLDREIELYSGLSPDLIINQRGEDVFLKIEGDTLEKLCESRNVLIACGGGTPCFGNNLTLMQSSGLCVLIEVPLAAIKQRLLSNKGFEKRPLLSQDEEQLEQSLLQLLESRTNCYNKIEKVLRPMQETKPEMLEKLKNWMTLA